MAGDFVWAPERDSIAASFCFASRRELDWARPHVDYNAVSGAEIYTNASHAMLTLSFEVPIPDSYSKEWRERAAAPDIWYSRAVGILEAAETEVELRCARSGLISRRCQPSFEGPFAPWAFDLRGLESQRVRGMPPTRRRTRRAACVLDRTPTGYTLLGGGVVDAHTTWLRHDTQVPVDPVPLLIGAEYWVTGAGESVDTIDVAVAADAGWMLAPALTACSDMGLDVSSLDPIAFLGRELQFRGVDPGTLGRSYRACVLEIHDALSIGDSRGSLANSLSTIARVRTGDAGIAERLRGEILARADAVTEDPSVLFAIVNDAFRSHGDARQYRPCRGGDVWIFQ
jgi:hypothetical protein